MKDARVIGVLPGVVERLRALSPSSGRKGIPSMSSHEITNT
jgi:hypothetical protein